jgi:hypothetical protein
MYLVVDGLLLRQLAGIGQIEASARRGLIRVKNLQVKHKVNHKLI